MDIYDVVMKLIGPVEPIGETRTDEKRLENLKQLTSLTTRLVLLIDDVEMCGKNSPMASIKAASDHAEKFMDDLGIPKQ